MQELESEKIKEVSQVSVEIKKLEDEVEEIKQRMMNKEGNPQMGQVQEFYE